MSLNFLSIGIAIFIIVLSIITAIIVIRITNQEYNDK